MAESAGNPMSFARYSASVPRGSLDHVWLGPLRAQHGTELHSKAGWAALVENMKAKPVSYANQRRVAAPRVRR